MATFETARLAFKTNAKWLMTQQIVTIFEDILNFRDTVAISRGSYNYCNHSLKSDVSISQSQFLLHWARISSKNGDDRWSVPKCIFAAKTSLSSGLGEFGIRNGMTVIITKAIHRCCVDEFKNEWFVEWALIVIFGAWWARHSVCMY